MATTSQWCKPIRGSKTPKTLTGIETVLCPVAQVFKLRSKTPKTLTGIETEAAALNG